jgi:cation diffusion facilitator family transporter
MSGHHHLTEIPAGDSRQAVTRRVALVGMSVNIFLTIAQIIGGILTHSQALVADAMHTLSDLVGDIVVLFASHHAAKAADDNHPYGHGRIETLATVILGLLLGGVSVAIFMRSWERLAGDAPLIVPEPAAMAIAALAIIGKEGLYHYTVHVAKRISSPMLKASAWHHRSDAISSVLVLLAIGGAQLGFPWLDSVAAIMVAVMIFYMAFQLIAESTSELVDTGLDPQEVQDIRDFIANINGVENIHLLRTRRMGGRVLADVHLQVDGRISVSEGHHIGETVMYRLRRQFPSISDVVIHIDPEDDETVHPCKNLPSRSDLLASLQAMPTTAALWPAIDDLTLHYNGGKLQLELVLKGEPSAEAIHAFRQACIDIPSIERIGFFTKIVHE